MAERKPLSGLRSIEGRTFAVCLGLAAFLWLLRTMEDDRQVTYVFQIELVGAEANTGLQAVLLDSVARLRYRSPRGTTFWAAGCPTGNPCGSGWKGCAPRAQRCRPRSCLLKSLPDWGPRPGCEDITPTTLAIDVKRRKSRTLNHERFRPSLGLSLLPICGAGVALAADVLAFGEDSSYGSNQIALLLGFGTDRGHRLWDADKTGPRLSRNQRHHWRCHWRHPDPLAHWCAGRNLAGIGHHSHLDRCGTGRAVQGGVSPGGLHPVCSREPGHWLELGHRRYRGCGPHRHWSGVGLERRVDCRRHHLRRLFRRQAVSPVGHHQPGADRGGHRPVYAHPVHALDHGAQHPDRLMVVSPLRAGLRVESGDLGGAAMMQAELARHFNLHWALFLVPVG